MALRAAVVGGGLGGMAAAVALARAGIDVRVYEQAQQLTEVGAGVSLALAAYQELRRDRTARIQLGSRSTGAGYDSSGSQLTDRRWIYEYDAWAEAAALT